MFVQAITERMENNKILSEAVQLMRYASEKAFGFFYLCAEVVDGYLSCKVKEQIKQFLSVFHLHFFIIGFASEAIPCIEGFLFVKIYVLLCCLMLPYAI